MPLGQNAVAKVPSQQMAFGTPVLAAKVVRRVPPRS